MLKHRRVFTLHLMLLIIYFSREEIVDFLFCSIPQMSAPPAPPPPAPAPLARRKYTLAEVFGDEDEEENSDDVAAAARQDYERPPPVPGGYAFS